MWNMSGVVRKMALNRVRAIVRNLVIVGGDVLRVRALDLLVEAPRLGK